ncbi:MAG: hypothetical protein JST54_28605 [Deltaproteobacteria bacterium]|nr:hypothetical protein [Deltaproteobacteria bacterium]
MAGGPRRASSGRTLAPFGLGVVIAIGTTVLAVRGALNAKPPPPPPAPAMKAAPVGAGPKFVPPVPSPSVQACLDFNPGEGQTAAWDRVLQLCTTAHEQDPGNVRAFERKALAQTELAQRPILARARKQLDAGELDAALDTLSQADRNTSARSEVQNLYKATLLTIMRRHGDDCVRAKNARQYAKAWDACKQFHDIACVLDTEDRDAPYQKAFLELNDHANERYQYVCNFKYHFDMLPPGTHIFGDTRWPIRKKYEDPDLAEAVYRYTRTPNSGIAMLADYAKHGRDPALGQRIHDAAEAAFKVHADARGKVAEQCAKALDQEIALEHTFMPTDSESDFVADDREKCATLFADQGTYELGKRNDATAFQKCMSGYALTRANLSVSGCLADLEAYAATLDVHSCTGAQHIVKITRPDSLPHKNADATLKGCAPAPKEAR